MFDHPALADQVDREHQHHHVDRGAAEVDELADALHATPEDQRLQHPHRHEPGPAERRQSEESVLVHVRPGRQTRPDLQAEDHERVRRQVRLDSVPGHRDEAADDGRDVGAENTEGAAAHDRVGDAGDLAGFGHQVREHVDDRDADHQRDEDLPAGQSEREQAARGDVAADAVHVGHPEREDVVRRPRLRLQRREIVVGESRVIAGLDQPGAGQVCTGDGFPLVGGCCLSHRFAPWCSTDTTAST